MKYLLALFLMAFITCNQDKQSPNANISKEKPIQKTLVEQPQDFDKNEAMLHIRKMFAKINEQTKNAEIIKKDVMDESAEGGQLKAFKKDGEIIKLEMLAFGEMGKATKEYYFENNKLIFAFTKEVLYDRPMYIEGAQISKTVENRYYFFKEILFKWLDPDKKEIQIEENSKKSNELLGEVKTYLSRFL
jgi:hypothetical protein